MLTDRRSQQHLLMLSGITSLRVLYLVTMWSWKQHPCTTIISVIMTTRQHHLTQMVMTELKDLMTISLCCYCRVKQMRIMISSMDVREQFVEMSVMILSLPISSVEIRLYLDVNNNDSLDAP